MNIQTLLQHSTSYRKTILLSLIAFAVIWYGWSTYFTTKQSTQSYQTTVAERGTLIVAITNSGQITSTNSRSVETTVTGVVKTIFVQNGQLVQAGDKIAEIDLDQDAKQTYTQALASYQSAKNAVTSAQTNLYTTQASMFTQWDSYKKLAESDTYKDTASSTRSLPEFHVSQNDWLAAEATYKNQQAVIAAAQTSLSSSAQTLRKVSPVIYAPISGKVTGLSLQKGSVLNAATTTIAKVITDATPTVTVNLSEIDVTKVSLGDTATITIDAIPNKLYSGTVVSIDTTGAVSSGVTSYPTVVRFDTTAPEIFSEMSAQVKIVTDTKSDVVFIPSGAITTSGDKQTVKVMKDGKAHIVSVTTGITSDTATEIVTGVAEGDAVITSTTSTKSTSGSTQATSPFSGIGGGFRQR